MDTQHHIETKQQMESQIKELASSNTANAISPSCPQKCPLAILDSGASCHISSCKELFVSLRPCTHVMTGVGSQKLQATAIGTMRLVCTHENGWYIVDLERALYVPESRITLISTSRLLEQYKTASITFTATGGTVSWSQTEKTSLCNAHGLYAFDLWHDYPSYSHCERHKQESAPQHRKSTVDEPHVSSRSGSVSRTSRSKRHYHYS